MRTLAGTTTTEVWRSAVGILHRVRETIYQHRTEVSEERGVYKLDCSGFVALVLSKCAPAALAEVEAADRPRHPRAFAYHEVISRAPLYPQCTTGGWSRIQRVADLQPGDILVWRRRTLRPSESTGHVGIVHDPPQLISNGIWSVHIIDSTTRPHAEDTRSPDQTGLGCGLIWILTDAGGRPSGYLSNPPAGSFVTNRPIAMGRVMIRDACGSASEEANTKPSPAAAAPCF